MATGALWEGRDAAAWQKLLKVPVVHLYETTGSTNDVARVLAEAGAPPLTVVIADHQTRGRGRAGRSWLSTPGASILCSIVFHSREAHATAPGAAPIRVGNAVARALTQCVAVDARVKWPNDIVITGHGKVAGILCESVVRPGGTFVVAGIGINVHRQSNDFAALANASKTRPSRESVLLAVVDAVRPFADDIMSPLSAAELADVRVHDILFGQEVVDDTGLAGVAAGITRDGSLLVKTADGVRTVHSATIRLAGSHDYPGARA